MLVLSHYCFFTMNSGVYNIHLLVQYLIFFVFVLVFVFMYNVVIALLFPITVPTIYSIIVTCKCIDSSIVFYFRAQYH